jgi:hypothetical protein
VPPYALTWGEELEILPPTLSTPYAERMQACDAGELEVLRLLSMGPLPIPLHDFYCSRMALAHAISFGFFNAQHLYYIILVFLVAGAALSG